MNLEVMLYNIYMNILQQIFKEHYEELIYLLNPRKSIIESVDRMIHCGDSSFGGALFGCEHCGNIKFVPFRCKSRFCPSCGSKYAIDRTTAMSFKCYREHKHGFYVYAKPAFSQPKDVLKYIGR